MTEKLLSGTLSLNQNKRKLEFMFMKHYAPNRCEPSIEVIVKMWVQLGEGVVGSNVGDEVVWGKCKKGGPGPVVRWGGQGGCEQRI